MTTGFENGPIRVGLIRCDMHGAYYGALFAEHDALALQRPAEPGEKTHYSWETGGAHFYFYTNYASPEQMTVEFVDGFRLTKVWDEHRTAAERLARVCKGPVTICDQFEEISDDVDLIFISDCNGDGSDHLELARPGLEQGIATFIDKPMANTYPDVQALVSLADSNSAPLASVSMLSMAPAAGRFAAQLATVSPAVEFGTVQGGGPSMAGQIHTVALALRLFGDGVESVSASGPGPLHTMHLSWGDRSQRPAQGVTLSTDVGFVWHCAFHASGYGPAGAVHSPPIGDFDFPFGAAEILKQVREMVRSGQSPAGNAAMIESVAVIEAARRAQTEFRSVPITEITGG
ncbi:MAG: Gfo/Idh/MocA family oxidoreductase [Candidatus Latescibacterota bacterium]|nr:Gfo/Idh/MocA family oxidoreductase [Candidatus Latescibacterota bacterium]